MTVINQYGLDRALILNLREVMPDVKVDLIFDGYEMPAERPLITVEQMPNNYEIISKGREAVRASYRYQIGLHDVNSVQLSVNQEKLQNAFLFHKFAYYDKSEVVGFFYCELSAVTPILADDISKKSDYDRVYFDIEIEDIKRRW